MGDNAIMTQLALGGAYKEIFLGGLVVNSKNVRYGKLKCNTVTKPIDLEDIPVRLGDHWDSLLENLCAYMKRYKIRCWQ